MKITTMTAKEIYETIEQDDIDNEIYRVYAKHDIFPAFRRRRVKKFTPHFLGWNEYCNGVIFSNYAFGEACPCHPSKEFWVVTS